MSFLISRNLFDKPDDEILFAILCNSQRKSLRFFSPAYATLLHVGRKRASRDLPVIPTYPLPTPSHLV